MADDVIRVLVTGAGTSSGVSVIRSLKTQVDVKCEMIACDPDPLAPGLHLADDFLIAPTLKEGVYLRRMLEIMEDKKIHVLIPCFSSEVRFWAQEKESLLQQGVVCLVSSRESIETCDNKRIFAKFCASNSIKTPDTYELETIQYPAIYKESYSSSGAGVIKLSTPDEGARLKMKPDSVIQSYIEGPEYTVDAFSDREGRLRGICARERLRVKAGQVVKSRTVSTDPFQDVMKRLATLLGLKGMWNAQFIEREYPNLIEINPRPAAGGLMLSIASGLNTPLMTLKELLGISYDQMTIGESGVLMTRYWNEIILREQAE